MWFDLYQALASVVPDTMALLALYVVAVASYRFAGAPVAVRAAGGWSGAVRFLLPRRLARATFVVFAVAAAQSVAWWAFVARLPHWDAVGTWGWNQWWDPFGETMENTMSMALLGLIIGVGLAVLGRGWIVRRWWRREVYRRFYLKSRHWREFRNDWWFRHPNAVCSVCHQGGRLDLHHISYAHLWHETDADVVPIHRREHIAHHGH